MADTKITALTAITTVDPAVDVLPIVDVSDTTMAASGTTKKITSNQILGAGGTATLASATITGDLTVDTSTLKVDSANNRVGIGTASPTETLHVSGGAGDGVVKVSNSSSGNSFIIARTTGEMDVFNAANSSIRFSTNATLQATLNSTGLGVGTSNFAYKINAAGFIAAVDPSFPGTGGSLIGAMLNNDNTFPGLDLRRWTGTAGTHGTTYIATDATGATFFYNGQQASNTKATALRLTLGTGGLLALNGGNAAANGVGIAFPATQVASSDANTLDDYEEGTWVPTISAASGTPTTTTVNSATYTKIGRQVVCTIDVSIVNKGTASSSLQFSLPFNQTTATRFCGAFREDGSTGNMGMIISSTSVTAACLLYNNATPWVDGYRVAGTYTYFIA